MHASIIQVDFTLKAIKAESKQKSFKKKIFHTIIQEKFVPINKKIRKN